MSERSTDNYETAPQNETVFSSDYEVISDTEAARERVEQIVSSMDVIQLAAAIETINHHYAMNGDIQKQNSVLSFAIDRAKLKFARLVDEQTAVEQALKQNGAILEAFTEKIEQVFSDKCILIDEQSNVVSDERKHTLDVELAELLKAELEIISKRIVAGKELQRLHQRYADIQSAIQESQRTVASLEQMGQEERERALAVVKELGKHARAGVALIALADNIRHKSPIKTPSVLDEANASEDVFDPATHDWQVVLEGELDTVVEDEVTIHSLPSSSFDPVKLPSANHSISASLVARRKETQSADSVVVDENTIDMREWAAQNRAQMKPSAGGKKMKMTGKFRRKGNR